MKPMQHGNTSAICSCIVCIMESSSSSYFSHTSWWPPFRMAISCQKLANYEAFNGLFQLVCIWKYSSKLQGDMWLHIIHCESHKQIKINYILRMWRSAVFVWVFKSCSPVFVCNSSWHQYIKRWRECTKAELGHYTVFLWSLLLHMGIILSMSLKYKLNEGCNQECWLVKVRMQRPGHLWWCSWP